MASIWDWLGNRADITFNGTRAVDEKRRREEEAERQRLIEAQRLADLEAQQQSYVEDAYADELYRRDRANTGAAIELGRQNMVSDMTQPRRIVTEQPSRYVDDREGRLRESDPILVVEDEVVDTTPSPMSYVLTGESYSDPRAPEASTPNDSNAFWDFLGLSDKEDRKRWSNGMLRAGGAILAGNDPDVWRNVGRGISAYGEAGDSYDKVAQERALNQQRIDAGKRTLDEADRKKAIQAEISSIIQAAGPDGLNASQRQRVAALQAELGDYTAANTIIGAGKQSAYQKGDTYYAPDGTLYSQVFNPTTGQMAFQDMSGNVTTDPEIIRTLRKDDTKRGVTGSNLTANLSKGEEKRDEEFGKNYEQTASDYNRNQIQFAQLENATSILEANPGASGNIIVENLPEFLKPYTNQDGTIAKERVYEVVQGTLRQVLGAQFTEKEGELIMQRAFNPNLPVEENIKRIRALAAMLKTNADMNKSKLDYFDTNGTLKGFKGGYLSADDISNNVFGTGVTTNSNRTLGGPVLNPNSSNLPAHLRKRG